MRKNEAKVSYEPEADVLMWQVSSGSIDSAKEVGNIIIHFDKKKHPILVEIIDASSFLHKAENLLGKARKSARKEVVVNK